MHLYYGLPTSAPFRLMKHDLAEQLAAEGGSPIIAQFRRSNELYQIALPATRQRRCGRIAAPVQVFDLTHVYDAIIPAQRRVT